MNRTPPKAVLDALAEEVGSGCPVEGCGSPYLTWHHFDPPWSERQHHDVEGMIALCGEHHSAADAGAWTPDQLREPKRLGKERAATLTGTFHWRRERLLAVVGGNYYFETPVALQIDDTPIVWFNRNDRNELLLNTRMVSMIPEARLVMADNYWVETGSASRLVCPPSGRLIDAEYPNGDAIRIEFFEVESAEALVKRYGYPPAAQLVAENGGFPITAVDIRMSLMRADGSAPLLELAAGETRFGEGNRLVGSMFARVSVGLTVRWADRLSSSRATTVSYFK